MAITQTREKIADDVYFTEITDDKLKINVLKFKFITELSEEEAPLNTLASMLIGSTNSRIKTYSEMSDKLNELYGASLYTDYTKSGDCQVITFTVDCIENRFAFENEDIFGQLTDIAEDCIFSPNASDGKFDQAEFDMKQRDLIETIYAEINNKRGYAVSRAQKTIFKNEPCSYSLYGTVEKVSSITPAQVYEAYMKLLDTAVVEVFYASSSIDSSIKKRIAEAFSKRKRSPQIVCFKAPSLLKDEVSVVSEEMEMNQAKAVMAYKVSSDDRDACMLAAKMFGGTPFSKLFSNVREKMSLCYYCAASYIYSKSSVLVESGVENTNASKLIDEVDNQLELMKKGEFTDEELENTKLFMLNGFRSVNDSPSSVINWAFSGLCFGDMRTPEEAARDVLNVTRERIIEAVKSFRRDTVYTLMASENSEGGGSDDDE